MQKCTNHSERSTALRCRVCGKPYCEECLTEAGGFLYCNEPKCRQQIPEQGIRYMLAPEIICPNCGINLKPSQEEQDSGIVRCGDCDAMIDFTQKEPVVKKKDEYIELFSTMNQGDVAVIKSILDDSRIDYYVLGENFLSVEPLVQPARFFIAKERADDVKELLKDFNLHVYGVSIE